MYIYYFFLMIGRPHRPTRNYTIFPYPTLFRSDYRVRLVEQLVRDRRFRNRLDVSEHAHRVLRARVLVGAGSGGGGRDGKHRKQQGQGRQAESHWRARSEEHTSELQSLMRISYAVFCLQKKNNTTILTSLF